MQHAMYRRLFILLCAFFSLIGFAHSQMSDEWVQFINADNWGCYFDLVGIAPDNLGNCYIGYKSIDSVGRLNIKKIDGSGVPVADWSVIGNLSNQCLNGKRLILAPDGNLVFALGTHNDGYHTFKFDPQLNLMWHHILDSGQTRATGFGPFIDNQGNIISLPNGGAQNSNRYIHKVSPSGVLLAGPTVIGTGGSICKFANYHGDSIHLITDLDPFVGAFATLVNLDSSLNIVDTVIQGSVAITFGNDFVHDSKSIMVTRRNPGINITKFDHGGVIEWQSHLQGTVNASNSKVILPMSNGDIYVTGNTTAQSVYLTRSDSVGTHLWTRTFDIPNASNELPTEIRKVSGNKILVAGTANSGSQTYFPWVALLDNSGNLLDYLINPSLGNLYYSFELSEVDAMGNVWMFFRARVSPSRYQYQLWKICVSECESNLGGKVWFDVNSDCQFVAADRSYQYVPVLVQPGNTYILTDGNGGYERNVGPGNWNVSIPLNAPWYNSCGTLVQSILNPGTANWAHDSVDFAMNSTLSLLDLRIALLPGVARVGRSQYINLYATNSGTTVTPATVYFIGDTAFPFISSTPPPDQISNDTLVWNIGQMFPFTQDTFRIEVGVPTTSTIGDLYSHEAIVKPVAGDILPNNNKDIFNWFIRGSFDPNDKVVNPGGATGLIDSNIVDLNYTINFQNTGNDTAFSVILRDTINLHEFDIGSFEMGPSSHSFRLEMSEDSILTWFFENILLPDSFVNEPLSHGYVRYSIQRKLHPDQNHFYCNRASIYFDFNLPVLTNSACVREDHSVANQEGTNLTLPKVSPNPADNYVQIQGVPKKWRDLKVDIFDLSGKKMDSKWNRLGENSVLIETQDFKNGVYMVSVSNGVLIQWGKVLIMHH